MLALAERDAMIPFNKPGFVGNELSYMARAIQLGQISGDGEFTRRCHEFLEKEFAGSRALLTTSCTHALELAALLCDFQPEDEVIVPDFTFVSTANAFALHGARPVFADVDPRTLTIDPVSVRARLTPRTRAIVPVHYAGIGCDMDELDAIARNAGAFIVEDNAHGIFGRYRGRLLGTFGALASLSFHETKNFICGEGGALLVNDAAFVDRAEILREKGTNRKRFFRGLVDKYTWVDVGSSFLPSDLLAAFLFAQLEQKESVLQVRRAVFERYQNGLARWADETGAQLPTIPPDRVQSYHMFYMVLPSAEARTALLAHLKKREILAVFHYQPLHLSEMGRRFGGRPGDCPVSERIADRLVRLPFYNDLTAEEQDRVIEAVGEFAP
jgi:dTDP-4-amino-4,6-dideoxygalactose transaminase